MCRKLVFMLMLVGLFGAAAQGQFIDSIVRTGNSTQPPPEIAGDPLGEDVLTFVDRTHQYNEVPESLLGAQYVMTSNSDKTTTEYTLSVSIAQDATLYLILDNRIGDTPGGLDVDPVLPAQMSWVTDLGFTDTGLDIGIDEGGDGDIDQYSSVFELSVNGGDVLDLGVQDDSGSRNNYGVAALGPKLAAYGPTPDDGAQITKKSTNLTWEAGDTAVSHDVYFSTDEQAVASGDASAFVGNQATTFVIAGADVEGAVARGGLEAGQTYYWRIDEVEADGTTHEGPVWSFSLPFLTATQPNPADGAQFISTDTETLSWETGFGAAFSYVYFGTDFDTVSNDNVPNMSQIGFDGELDLGDAGIELEKDTTYYWRVDETDGTTTYKGDVWSFTTAPPIEIEDPNLLVWYKFDEIFGDIAPDMSGYDHHATVNGATFEVAGQVGGALEFDGDGDHVFYQDCSFLNGLGAITVSVWVKSDVIDTDKGFYIAEDPAGQDENGMRYDTTGATAGGDDVLKLSVVSTEGNQQLESSQFLQRTEWQHYAMVWQSGEQLKFYVNGFLDTPTVNADATAGTTAGFVNLYVGQGGKGSGSSSWDGLVDDFRIYDKALSAEEIQLVMRGEPDLAWNPAPSNGDLAQIAEAQMLSWSPGDFAVQHDVYFGMDRDAVRNADTGSAEYKGRQANTTYSIASMVELGGGPYFWRIDEINNDSTISEGRVWTFSIADYIVIDDMEDYNNFSPDTIWEAWVDGFGNPNNGSQVGYDLGPTVDEGEFYVELSTVHSGSQSMPYFYDNSGQASEATMTLMGDKRDWTQYNVKALSLWYQGFAGSLGGFAQGSPGVYTMQASGADIWGQADQFHYAWKTLSGSGTIQARVSEIVSTTPGATLNIWAKGGVMMRETLEPNSVNAFSHIAPNGDRVRLQFRPETAMDSQSGGNQPQGISYPHWVKLERDFNNNFIASHANDVGGFPDKWTELNRAPIQMASQIYVGLALTSHSAGNQAEVTFDEITTTGTVSGGAWTNQDIGIQSNAAEQMYVKITDGAGQSATVANPDPAAAQVTEWTEWGEFNEGIELSAFTAQNPSLNLANVASMTLGFGPPAGGSGLVFFDDIRLYPPRYVPGLGTPVVGDLNDDGIVNYGDLEILVGEWLESDSEIATTAPGAANAAWEFDGNLSDSAGSSNGTAQGTVGFTGGVFGNAADFGGSDGYVTVADNAAVEFGAGSFTVSAWVLSDYVAGSDKQFVVANGTNGSEFTDASGKRYVLKFEGSNFRFTIDDDATKTICNGDSDDFATGDWVHAAAIRDADMAELRLYANGVMVNSTGDVATGDIASPGEPLYIGAKLQEGAGAANLASTPVDHFYSGMIDSLKLYGQALTDAEVAYLADATPADGSLYVPLVSEANVAPKVGDDGVFNPDNLDVVNFEDYAVLVDNWLEQQLWP